MLNSSWRLIGSWVFPFSFPFFCIDWQPGGTGKQNISHQASAPVEKKALFLKQLHLGNVFGGKKGKNLPPPEFQKWLGQLLHSLRLPTCGNTVPKMSCFASISMQTAGPPFPEVKITASVCAQSHFEPRQTPLIWRLLAPALTSCFLGARKWQEKKSERRKRIRLSREPRLLRHLSRHFSPGRRPFISPSRAVRLVGGGYHGPHFRYAARLKQIV